MTDVTRVVAKDEDDLIIEFLAISTRQQVTGHEQQR